MFARLGRLAADHSRSLLAVTVLLLIGAAALGFTAFGKLQSQGFTDPNAESSQAQALIDQHFGADDLVFLVEAKTGTVDDATVRAAGTELTDRVAADRDLANVTSYWRTGAGALKSDDGHYALIVARPPGQHVADVVARYAGDDGPVTITAGGRAVVNVDITKQVSADLMRAETIAVPVIAILLVIVFGSVVAALLPLVVGGIAVLGTFAELSVLGSLTDVSVFAINLTTALGLGLGIDYALLTVSRFREELAGGADPRTAVVRTVASAGRTIAFSAATVAVALAALLLFPLYFLRSFAYAGIGVIVIAMAGAVLVLPALLAILGPRVNKGRAPWARGRMPSTMSPFWARVAGGTMKRPLRAAIPVLVVLLLAAAPLLGVRFTTPDDRVLPTSAPSRVVGDTLRAHFPDNDSTAIRVVAAGDIDQTAATDYARRLHALPGVADVSVRSVPGAEQFSVISTADTRSPQARDLVAQIRRVPAPVPVKVGGETATLADTLRSIGTRIPLATGLIAVTTFVLLFLFTGSVLQPLRALLFNLFSLAATLGVMTLIFQDGFGSSLLGFTPLPLEASMLMLLFCITFGLSMDYEVFVVSRIKEAHDHGADPHQAAVNGLSRTGRIVSAAAVLLAVSVFAFGTSRVSFIQLFGLGTGLAILLDATLVRGILMPAALRLLGRYAWWSPAPLRRLHARIGLSETIAEPGRTDSSKRKVLS